MNDSSPACDYCGLPIPTRRWLRVSEAVASEPQYCCSGCRLAAAIFAADDDGGDHAKRTMVKLGLAGFFAMNVMVFSMALWSRDVYAEQLAGAGRLADVLHQVFRYLAMLFSLPVLWLLGAPLVASVWQAIRRATITTDVLLLLGIAAAFTYSVWSVSVGEGQVYFDVASLILVFLTLGRWLEAQGKLQSGQALDSLARLLPETVHVLREGRVCELPRDAAAVSDLLLVFPGERFAVDGIIRTGKAEIDEQTVTGESRTVIKTVGDRIYSGTLNLDGDLRVEVTAAAGAETVSRMLALVREARRERSRYQRLADRITAWFVPAVAVVAIATTWWHGQHGGVDTGILAGLAVVLIACPCALGLATPMALWIALGRAANSQVLFRSGLSLEQLAHVKTVFFDKTGTLTSGQPEVRALLIDAEGSYDEIAARAASLAAASNHCLAVAISRYLHTTSHEEFVGELATLPGHGMRGNMVIRNAGQDCSVPVLLGSMRWLESEGLAMTQPLLRALAEAEGHEATLSCIGWQGQICGVFVFQEELRPDAQAAVAECRRLRIAVQVLTGDRQPRAERLAGDLHVPVLAEQLPADKVAAIRSARTSAPLVAMVGDGLNDAPALAASDVGIALGCGADLARDTAAVCLLSNDLARVPWTVELARRTVHVIRQNLCWAFSYNVIGISLAATGRLSPVWSAIAMVASSAFVVSNSLRLGRFAEPAHPQPCSPAKPRDATASEMSPYTRPLAPQEELQVS